MKTLTLATLVFLLAANAAPQSVYVCAQPNGVREYRNTGDIRGCRLLVTDALSSIPAPPSVKQAAASASPSASSATPATPATPATTSNGDSVFPRIDSQVQKRRDQDRMQILLNEVRTEETRLTELQKEYQNGEPERQGNERNYAKYQERVAMLKEEIARTEKNIEALKREIGHLK